MHPSTFAQTGLAPPAIIEMSDAPIFGNTIPMGLYRRSELPAWRCKASDVSEQDRLVRLVPRPAIFDKYKN